jgi:UDP-N-acetylmuramoyl-L-alanyl-D-glutamate--2,6-diaminopimelate ligase
VVVCIDDAWGRRLASEPGAAVAVTTFGRDGDADIRAVDVHLGPDGARFRAVTPWGEYPVRLGLAGRFNIDNALAALGAAGSLGCDLGGAADALADARPAPGRMEVVPNAQGIFPVVDYAHTDDALGKVLEAVREVVSGRLIAVFGCGGDRDRGKRPRMAAAAARWADFVVVTSDNPRTEEPERIFHDIEVGFEAGQRFVRIPDRRAAIAYALRLAGKGDGVLIAGKGHETYQEIGHTVKPFDDRQVVRELLDVGADCPQATGVRCG